MTAPIKQCSFSGGEVAPALYGRTDHVKYETGLRTLLNMIAMRHGGVTGRPGTMYVGTTMNGGNQVRLLPFIFNEVAAGQSYLLEFGNLYIGFYQNGGVVTSGGSPYTISSPYLQADLQNLKFAQSADVVIITHQNYPPQVLKRLGPTSWTLTPIVFGPSANGNVTITGYTTTTGANYFKYMVTSISPAGDESNASGSGTQVVALATPMSPTAPTTISWTAPSGFTPSQYRVYRAPCDSAGSLLGSYGYVGTVAGTALSFFDTIIDPDYTQQPPIFSPIEGTGSGGGSGNYPSAVGFIQQRLALAATANNPLGFWMSQSGVLFDFDLLTPQTDDAPIASSLVGAEVNTIQHIIEQKFMLLFTSGAEMYVQGNGSGVVTPSAINASVQSSYGCSSLRPLKVGDVLLFNQALGSFIRDFAFDFSIDGYRGNDITVFSTHLFEGHTLTDWAYQKIPDSIVWTAREDGVLLGLTYVREQQILAWHRHDFTNGFVENVCTIPENGGYAVYLSIRRVINGSTVRYIERMSSRIWPNNDPIDATYLDCFAKYDGRVTANSDVFLNTVSGPFDTSSSAYQQMLTLTSFGAFGSVQVGDQIFLEDAQWIATQGDKGNQLRLTVQAVINSGTLTVTPSTVVQTQFQSVAVHSGYWAHAVRTVTGLGYLEGQQVSVWADRYVVGSPLNTTISKVYTVTGGSITLDKCYSVIYVGLPMKQDFQTLDLETSFGETILASRKRVVKLGIYLLNTRTFFAGSQSPDDQADNTANDPLFDLFEFKRGTDRDSYDEPHKTVTDQDYVLMDTRWNKNGRLFIRNVDPVPLSILAVSPGGDSKAPTPFYEKV